jgi:hypothetical protein
VRRQRHTMKTLYFSSDARSADQGSSSKDAPRTLLRNVVIVACVCTLDIELVGRHKIGHLYVEANHAACFAVEAQVINQLLQVSNSILLTAASKHRFICCVFYAGDFMLFMSIAAYSIKRCLFGCYFLKLYANLYSRFYLH